MPCGKVLRGNRVDIRRPAPAANRSVGPGNPTPAGLALEARHEFGKERKETNESDRVEVSEVQDGHEAQPSPACASQNPPSGAESERVQVSEGKKDKCLDCGRLPCICAALIDDESDAVYCRLCGTEIREGCGMCLGCGDKPPKEKP